MTLGELFDWFLEHYAKPRKKTWAADEEQFRRYFQKWRGRRLSSITWGDVQAWHTKAGTRAPYAANRALALLSSLYKKAHKLGYVGNDPTKGISRFPERSRDRFLQPDELPKFFEALDTEPDPTFRDFFLLALLTGARRGNLQSMRCEDVNLERRTWRIPDTKSGDALTLPLSEAAVDVLKSRMADNGSSPWVFPGRGQAGHLVEPKSAWDRLIKRAGIKDLRLHDLRRTLGSWQAAAGSSLLVIGKSLGHKQQSTTAIYARLNLDPVRQSIDAATTAMLGAAKKKKG